MTTKCNGCIVVVGRLTTYCTPTRPYLAYVFVVDATFPLGAQGAFLFGKPNRKGWRYGDNHGYDNTQGDYKPRAVN